jgi:hypothetical protein
MTTQNMIGRPYSTTPTSTTISSWDANSNLSSNNQLIGYATTATAAGTTTLTVSSPYQQFFTGVTTQTVTMPVTSTLVLGQSWYIVNNSSGVVTVQSSGANTIISIAANTVARLTCISTSGTGTASWFAEYDQSSLTLPLSPSNGGTGVSNSGNMTWGGAVTFSGAFTTAFTITANTSVTFPTAGILATTDQVTAASLYLMGG